MTISRILRKQAAAPLRHVHSRAPGSERAICREMRQRRHQLAEMRRVAGWTPRDAYLDGAGTADELRGAVLALARRYGVPGAFT